MQLYIIWGLGIVRACLSAYTLREDLSDIKKRAFETIIYSFIVTMLVYLQRYFRKIYLL